MAHYDNLCKAFAVYVRPVIEYCLPVYGLRVLLLTELNQCSELSPRDYQACAVCPIMNVFLYLVLIIELRRIRADLVLWFSRYS